MLLWHRWPPHPKHVIASCMYIGHRREELADWLCVVCGWVTSNNHATLSCDRMLGHTCYSESDLHLCHRCIHVQGEEVLCIFCLNQSHAGITDADRVLWHAWTYSNELHDAIQGNWVHAPELASFYNPVYPFSVTQVVRYNANAHLPSCALAAEIYYGLGDELAEWSPGAAVQPEYLREYFSKLCTGIRPMCNDYKACRWACIDKYKNCA